MLLVAALASLGLVVAPAASALNATDITTALSDVNGGTATAGETQEVQGVADWVAYANGVTDPSVWPYPINGAPVGGPYGGYGNLGGYVDELDAAEAAAPAGGATEVAVGGELAAAGAAEGVIPTVAAAVPVLTVGAAARWSVRLLRGGGSAP